MWDADANGYARGEGVAAVFMKTLSAAIADGDNIECIIRETGVNQDGRSRGITMPSAIAQATLIRETYARAGLDVTKDRCQVSIDKSRFYMLWWNQLLLGSPPPFGHLHLLTLKCCKVF